MSALPLLPEPGQIVADKYLVLRQLGDGGMARVYEAQHRRLGISVALKFLHPRLLRYPALVERFLQEARMVARIRSPHVVQVLDVEQDPQGLAFIVMEHLAGSTLRAWEDRAPGRRLPPSEALRLAIQLCEGLEAVHAAGIVHRDLKPDNLMIHAGPSGAPTLELLDFGIALPEAAAQGRGEAGGAVLGTPEYMAPEQLSSADAVDLRADLFSLGVLLYEMLAGCLPAAGDAPRAIAACHREGRIPRLDRVLPGLAPELAAVVHRAMAPAPGDRFASAAELREALEPWVPVVDVLPSPTPGPVSVEHDPGEAIPTTVEAPWFTVEPGAVPVPVPAPVPAPPARRSRMLLAATLGVITLGALGLSVVALAPAARSTGRAPSELANAVLAAPITVVEADPPAPLPVPEVTPAPPPPSRALPAPVVVTAPAPPRPVARVQASLPPSPPPRIEVARPPAAVVVAPSCHGGGREQVQVRPRIPEARPERRPPEPVFATPPPSRMLVPVDPPRRRVLLVAPVITLIR